MNSGTLNFVLGLNASGFLGPLTSVAGKLAAVTGGLVSFGAVVKGVWAAIERGGKLNDLSARTSTAVGDLYQLQEAFAVVGVEVNSLPGMILKLNKSLSGVGEMGERTTEAFAAMGLDIETLKRMNAPAQFTAIMTALQGMDKAGSADVASRIFGREGSGNILQLANDAKSFKQTLAESAREAAVFARNAAAFDKLGDTFTRIKGQVSGLFAGVAEGIVPALQGMADALKSLDLVTIGQDIGTLFTGAFQAFREGKISELIAESIIAGFEAAVLAIPGLFAQLGMVILRVMETPLTYIQAFYDMMVGNLAELLSKIPGNEGASQGGFMTFPQALKERQEQGLEFFTPGNTLGVMQEGIDAYWADAKGRLSQIGSDWFGSFKEFKDRAPKPGEAGAPTAPGGGNGLGGGGGGKPANVTSLEKIGFAFGGGMDVGKQQLTEAKKSNTTLTKILNKLSPGADPTNA